MFQVFAYEVRRVNRPEGASRRNAYRYVRPATLAAMPIALSAHGYHHASRSCLCHAHYPIQPFIQAMQPLLITIYWVLTSLSASTLRCSFDCSVCTLSAGNSALPQCISIGG